MKKLKSLLINTVAFLFLVNGSTVVFAQKNLQKALKPNELNHLVNTMSRLVEHYYITLAEGKKMSHLIQHNLKSGVYSKISNPADLAKRLTKDLRSINGDLHMNVFYNIPHPKKTSNVPRLNYEGEWSNFGLQEAKVLAGNVGYLKVKHFTTWSNFENAKKAVQRTLKTFSNTDALIVDVRNNGGGFEEIVAYLISYFFDGKRIHLSDYYCRHDGNRTSVWTSADVPGKKLPKLPIYVLVNKKTGSAAESFAYMLKHLKRATIIGETTAGAGNGASYHTISEHFAINIACQQTINAITKTSFEQVGVIPHIKTSGSDAFSRSYREALKHLKEHNTKKIHPSHYEKLLKQL
ncbi:MAG TPA: hypothetical protein DCS93_40720 [Microscillaceae bacterium]|nr:hypothetical protein [Microscillaceae bacterium]